MIGTEDCLYLSLYVPKNALDNNLHLPVYLYFHGGAYLGGASNAQDGAYIASTQNLGRDNLSMHFFCSPVKTFQIKNVRGPHV